MSKYYTPDITEFVEGFKYQVANSFRLDIIDFANPENNKKGNRQTVWYDRVVPNLDPIEYPYTIKDESGMTYTIMNNPFPDEDPLHSIKVGLKNKTIRALNKLNLI